MRKDSIRLTLRPWVTWLLLLVVTVAFGYLLTPSLSRWGIGQPSPEARAVAATLGRIEAR